MGQGTSQHVSLVESATFTVVKCWDVPCPTSYALVKRPTDVITRPMIPQLCPDSGGRGSSPVTFCAKHYAAYAPSALRRPSYCSPVSSRGSPPTINRAPRPKVM